ncbi:O-antigen ligase family protein [Aestuariibacter halophilus]|uniref:O-antigen ligase family protein n=1 Tax=Fluctibacter halophilus TaxID=226011 RepID=A0ABS8GEY4_9ALTE|nr:O-antigen ligase family protein [Aestuariibacter halophilus]MCC2618339.1 O-antigen ligase family protein [Aestuariibacter halophilus]
MYASLCLIAAICVLNLNGVGVLMLGVGQLFSLPLLLASALGWYWAVLRKPPVSQYLLVYLGVLTVYLGMGLLASVIHGLSRIDFSATVFVRYLTTAFIIVSVYLHVKMLGPESEQRLLRFVLVLIVIASALIPFSAYINISGALVTSSGRGTGVFANPNEAGIVAVSGIALALSLELPAWLRRSLIVFLAAMAVMTFSKTSMMLCLLVYLAYQGLKPSLGRSLVYVLVTVVIGWGTLSLFKQDIIEQFDPKQAVRIAQLLNVLTMQGDVSDDDLTSGRAELWELGMEKISRHPFMGNGLGELHSMEEARTSVNKGVGQGVHNTYLLKLGDAGIFALSGFLFFILFFLWHAFRLRTASAGARFVFLYMLVFAINAVSSHGMELLRFHNFFLGLSMALLAHAARQSQQSYLRNEAVQ